MEEIDISINKFPIESPLERQLNLLYRSKFIDEVFLFTNNRKDEIEQTLSSIKKIKPTKCLFSRCGDSLGDKIREVHSMREIETDFLLMR